MDIAVLGPLTIDGSEVISRRDRVVLESLATRPGQAVSVDALSSAVWGDAVPASAVKVLQGCVVRLRKRLGADAIVTGQHGYTLQVPADRLDAGRFEHAVARGRELLALGEADRSVFVLGKALELWRGEPFADLADWESGQVAARRLVALREDAEEMWVDAQLRAGRHREALRQAEALVREAPLREHRWALLARGQYQVGQQADALRTIHQLKAVLADQLGIDPGADVAALESLILRQDPALASQPAAVSDATCPWRGLRAYDVEDADRFFGREEEVRACLQILDDGRALALVGPSGSGKSSLMRAGVGAVLRDRAHPPVTLTPGVHPLEALTALRSAPATAALLVDQLEEAFSLCPDAAERAAFLDAVVTESASRPVVLAMRADRLSDLTTHPRARRLVERGLYLVGGLGEAGLRQAIVGPAQQAGLRLEPGLVDLLVVEVREDPGALPLLSHALVETWNRREGTTLTVDGYRSSGGIHGAVAQSAEQLYARIEPERRHVLRDLLLRLLVPGTEGEPVRSRVPRRLIGTDAERDRLIELLVAARLVTVDDGSLEITHESLARAWPRLRGWLDDDVEGRRTMHHLSAAADAWDSLGRPTSELYRGIRLTRALAWQRDGRATLAPVEAEFLEQSRIQSQIEEETAADRARAQAQMIRRLRIVVVGATALLVLSLVAGAMAAIQSGRARDNAAAAQASQIQALAGGAAARSAAADDPDTALLLALAAVDLHESPQTVGSLVSAVSRHSTLATSVPWTGDDPRSLDVHPAGKTVAVLDTHHRLRLLDRPTGQVLAERQVGPPRNEAEETRPLRFSPDGELLAVAATALTRRPVRVLDPHSLEPARWQPEGLSGRDWQVIDLKFDHRGGSLVAVLNRLRRSAGARETTATVAAVWTIGSRNPPRIVDLTNPGLWASAALSPGGRLLYTVSPDLRVHDLRIGSRRTLGTSDATFGSIEVSPDGRLLAWGQSQLGQTPLIDARTGRVVHRLRLVGQQGQVRFSDDGRRVVTVIWHDRDAAVWDVRSGERVATLALGEGNSGAVDVSGDRLVSAATDGAVREWYVDGAEQYLRRMPIEGLPPEVQGDPCLVIPSSDARRVTYDLCTGNQFALDALAMLEVSTGKVVLEDRPGTESVGASGSWDRAGSRFAQVVDHAVHVWDASGRLLQRRTVADDVIDAQLTPSGDRLVLSETTGRVRMLDADRLRPVGETVTLDGSAWAIPGPDDRHAFTTVGGTDPTFFWRNRTTQWALVDLDEGVVVREGPLDLAFPMAAAVAADGHHAAVADDAGALTILNLTTGEPVRDPVRHPGGIGWMSFSADGRRLVTGSFDGIVTLWDVETATINASIRVPGSVLTSPAFRSDGTILIVPWADDPAVYEWNPSVTTAMRYACQAVGRDMSETEWTQYFGSVPHRAPCDALVRRRDPSTAR